MQSATPVLTPIICVFLLLLLRSHNTLPPRPLLSWGWRQFIEEVLLSQLHRHGSHCYLGWRLINLNTCIACQVHEDTMDEVIEADLTLTLPLAVDVQEHLAVH